MQEYKVLIVEDDPMVAMINEQYVCKNAGFTVAASCRNGKEALEFLKSNKADLVVLDVYMPVMDGIETLKEIRQNKIPVEVIMVTAANDTATLEDTMHLGVLDYLIKPFAFERFQVALEKFSSKVNMLKKTETVDQNCIDSLISGRTGAAETTDGKTGDKKTEERLPKGIQHKTLELIINFFEQSSGWQTGDTVSKKLGISIVTVRHYMNFLVEQKKILQDIDYGTGGRPCMLYKKL